MAYSKCGQHIAIGLSTGDIKFYNSLTFELFYEIPYAHDSEIYQLVFCRKELPNQIISLSQYGLKVHTYYLYEDYNRESISGENSNEDSDISGIDMNNKAKYSTFEIMKETKDESDKTYDTFYKNKKVSSRKVNLDPESSRDVYDSQCRSNTLSMYDMDEELSCSPDKKPKRFINSPVKVGKSNQ